MEMNETVDNEHNVSKPTNMQFLIFKVASEEYGIDITKIREIKGWSPTTKLPNTPDYMLGVMNLRGLIIPIFDLKNIFNKGLTQANEKNVVIIITVNNKTMGILVDSVSDIVDTNSDQIKPAPSSKENGPNHDFISGLISLEDRMVVLLEVEKLYENNMVN
jgi:purine-binding chemotaxis protein CheW